MWAIFNVFIELVMILFLFLFFGHVACGILAPQPEPESTTSALKSKVLTSVQKVIWEVPLLHFKMRIWRL